MDQAKPYEIAGHPVTCTHCKHGTFFTRRTLLNSRGMTFLELDWLNEDAVNYICARCGHLMWFFDLPAASENDEFSVLLSEEAASEEVAVPVMNYEAPESEGMPEPTECLSCGEMIPSHQTKCPACGWSYRNDSGNQT